MSNNKIMVTGVIGSGKSTAVKEMLPYYNMSNMVTLDIDRFIADLYQDPMIQVQLSHAVGTYDKASIRDMLLAGDRDHWVLVGTKLQSVFGPRINAKLSELYVDARPCVIEYAMLFDTMAIDPMLTAIVSGFQVYCVPSPGDDIVRERILNRPGNPFSPEQADKIMSFQMPSWYQENLATAIIRDGMPAYREFTGRELADLIPVSILDFASAEYNKVYRYYHTWAHIDRMLNSYRMTYPRDDNDPAYLALLLATIFHDIVYDVGSSTNEEDSVACMRRLCGMFMRNLPEDVLLMAEIMILSTKHHRVPESADLSYLLLKYNLMPAFDAFLDADLLVFLNADMGEIDDYEYEIRKEYERYEDEDYYPARIRILESFIARDRLYRTDWFHRIEYQARNSISHLIAECYKDRA